ncbi:MAG: S1 RNA-binding domain-containing protein [Planctomycetota bacterium]
MTSGDQTDASMVDQESASTPPSDTAPNTSVEPPTEAGADSKPVARGSGPLAARGLGIKKPTSPSVSTEDFEKAEQQEAKKRKNKKAPRPRLGGEREKKKEAEPNADDAAPAKPKFSPKRGRVAIPNRRSGLDDDLQAELDSQLAGTDVDEMLGGMAGMADRKDGLAEGTRVHALVLKIQDDSVFVSLGGPDEGVVPFEQFETEPKAGDTFEVVVRAMNSDDGLYVLSLPNAAMEVTAWEDMDEGAVVEAQITGANSGGLECKVGGMKGFIPISQISEYRVEDTSEFVDKRLLCVVTEANQRRGNLILSHKAVLQREREAKRKEQLETLEAGDIVEGTVQSIKDFGIFVDLGALEGLVHISKLSWERIKHPSEVAEVGQKVKVKIDSINTETGKISLSYRDTLENPWDAAEATYAVGSIVKGSVTRIAPFGCFVKLGPGVEGLVHISELAHHRVSKVDAFISEGQEVEVKVLSFDRDSQKIALSIKQAQTLATPSEEKPEETAVEPPREVAVKPSHDGPLRGGNNRATGGEKFGLRW